MSVILISMLLRLNEMAETMVAWPIGGAPASQLVLMFLENIARHKAFMGSKR